MPTKTATKTKNALLEEIEAKNAEIKDLKKRVEALDRYKVYEDGANELAAVRDAYINAGFTEEQAWELAKMAFEGALKKAFPW